MFTFIIIMQLVIGALIKEIRNDIAVAKVILSEEDMLKQSRHIFYQMEIKIVLSVY